MDKGWRVEMESWYWERRKDYFEDLNNIDTQEQVAVYMYAFGGVQRGNYFREEPM